MIRSALQPDSTVAVFKEVELYYERDMARSCVPDTGHRLLITDYRCAQRRFWGRRRAGIADILAITHGISAPFFWYHLD